VARAWSSLQPVTGELEWIQGWYVAQCDGQWEHEYGITIGTLDNPGWTLRVDLVGTSLEGTRAFREATEGGEGDWFQAEADGQTFAAAGGSRNLTDLVAAFARFVEAA
jgi:Immunity protein 53